MATLATLVARWRLKLDDAVPDNAGNYLWSDAELTDYANQALIDIGEVAPIFQDATTADVSVLAVAVGEGELALSDRVVALLRAKLTSQDYPLSVVTAAFMDANYGDWEDADNGTPTHLVKDYKARKLFLYPPSDAIDTLTLTVWRVPTEDLVYLTDSGDVVEIPSRYFEVLESGVCYRAYEKPDTDTEDMARSRKFYDKLQQGLERVRRAMLQINYMQTGIAPHSGAM